ncbi:MAG: tripartite tricarboxylate transporter substrate binding protein [Enhydrobacter sp.]|nr:MAG: tripartite tricarboxylate transporter substrate binding protein [Enhydrobacter sp.]
MIRRRTLGGLGALTASLLSSGGRAQTPRPEKPLRVLIGFIAGGGTDFAARAIARRLEQQLSQRITMENRSGDAGALPGLVVKNAPGDGSTLAFLASTTLVSRLSSDNFPFDPIADLAPITLAGTWPIAFAVSPKLGIRTFPEYLAWLEGGDLAKMRLGNTASDTFIQAVNLMVGRAMGVTFEPVDYRGAAPLVNDLHDVRLPAAASGLVSLLPHHRGGRVRLLFTTAPQRLAVAPDIPTARELGYPGLEMLEWFAFFASRRTPPDILAGLHKALAAALADRVLAQDLAQIGMTVESSTPEQLVALIGAHQAAWRERLRIVGMTLLR